MIPEEVENRIARYFFHNFLPEDLMYEIEDLLLPQCLCEENEEDIDIDSLVYQAVIMLQDQLHGKSIK